MTSDSPPASDPCHRRQAPNHGVVVNDEEQYSIWPLAEPLPAGWVREGVLGTAEECLAHIGRVWTDMRPLSIRGG